MITFSPSLSFGVLLSTVVHIINQKIKNNKKMVKKRNKYKKEERKGKISRNAVQPLDQPLNDKLRAKRLITGLNRG